MHQILILIFFFLCGLLIIFFFKYVKAVESSTGLKSTELGKQNTPEDTFNIFLKQM